jgi:hypothetical protein
MYWWNYYCEVWRTYGEFLKANTGIALKRATVGFFPHILLSFTIGAEIAQSV